MVPCFNISLQRVCYITKHIGVMSWHYLPKNRIGLSPMVEETHIDGARKLSCLARLTCDQMGWV